jgi:hypothetical protein
VSARTIGLIGGVVAAMAVVLALPPHDLELLIFGTLALVAVFCAVGWIIGGQLERPAAEGGEASPAPRPPARHVFVGAAAAIVVIVIFAAPVASASSVLAAIALLGGAAVVGVAVGAASKRFWPADED